MSDCVAFISKNKIEVLNLKTNEIVSGTGDFTSSRLLLGDFIVAEDLLKQLIKKAFSGALLLLKPRLLIQPLEMVEGGLCHVEERAFMELGQSAGARKVIIHLEESRLTKEKALSLF